MELFGLKDKDGKEWKLITRSNSLSVEAEPIEPKPAFKVGDWACYCFLKGVRGTPFKIISFDEDRAMGNSFDGGGVTPKCYIHELYSATPAEVEAHLRYICDKKGFRSGIKIRGLNYEGKPYRDCYVIEMPATYIADEDCMLTVSGDRIYCQGRFAEILPEHKKEFPKTVEELIDLIQGFGRSPIPSVSEFLKEQGYTD